MEKDGTLETELFHVGLILLAAGGGIAVLYSFLPERFPLEVPCLFSSFLGIYCPGCGGTRAAAALFRGQIFLALWYHPLVPYMAFLGGGFMATQALGRMGTGRVKGWRFHNWYLHGAIILIAFNFILKNVLKLLWGIAM